MIAFQEGDLRKNDSPVASAQLDHLIANFNNGFFKDRHDKTWKLAEYRQQNFMIEPDGYYRLSGSEAMHLYRAGYFLQDAEPFTYAKRYFE